jgi:cell division protein FtsW
MTATLCLIAFGAVMVYSASSPQGVVNGSGYGTGEFLMYLFAAGIGLIAMRVGERYGLQLLTPQLTTLFVIGSTLLLLAVLVPGLGQDNGTGIQRWIGAGSLEFQPSELTKLALVLYVARYLADNPKRVSRGFKQAVAPIAIVVGPACLLIAVEPDLGTTLVVFFTVISMLVVAGFPMRYLGRIAMVALFVVVVFVIAEPYQRARLTSFLHPFAQESSNGWQSAQGQIAVGSGGIFGVGIGNSVEKLFWLPEAQTDFILAVIGEELGLLGILAVACLYGMIAYAGMRTARRAATRYTKLLASGLTSLILCQGILNIFVVLGIAPLTGVPLPFISYAPTNLVVMLVSVGLLMGITRPAARELRLVDRRESRAAAVARETTSDLDRDRRYGGARGAGAGRR